MKRSRSRSNGFNGRTAFYQAALGKTFVNYEHEVVFDLKDLQITRSELATRFGCCHLSAARRLSNNLKLHGITRVNELHATPPDELMGLAGVGVVQLFVALCILSEHGIDIEKYYGYDADTVTANTLRLRAKRAAEQAR